jgi:hypothetical protein
MDYVVTGTMKAAAIAALLLIPIHAATVSAAEVAPAPAKPAAHRLHKKDPCADKARAAAAKNQKPAASPHAGR